MRSRTAEQRLPAFQSRAVGGLLPNGAPTPAGDVPVPAPKLGGPTPGFWVEVWHEVRHEVQGLVVHTLATLILLACVFAIGLGGSAVKWCLGTEGEAFYQELAWVDRWIATGTLYQFAVGAFIRLTTLGWLALWKGWPGQAIRWLWDRRRPQSN